MSEDTHDAGTNTGTTQSAPVAEQRYQIYEKALTGEWLLVASSKSIDEARELYKALDQPHDDKRLCERDDLTYEGIAAHNARYKK